MKIKKMFAATLLLFAFFAINVSAQSFLIGPKAEKKWMQSFYRANGAAPAPKPSLLLADSVIGFNFLDTPDTSLFTTVHPAYNEKLLGDQFGKTVMATIEVTATPGTQFTYYGQNTASNPCGRSANVRLYFSTKNNDLGESQYWWSNPSSYDLAAGTHSFAVALNAGNWSDRDGHMGTYDAGHTAAFEAAASDIQEIGFSGGGGCFFANGVGATGGTATFKLTNYVIN